MASSRRRSTRLKGKEQDVAPAVGDIIAALSLEFDIPITVSKDPNDELVLNEIVGMYTREGAGHWDTKTRFAFAKALPLVKTTASSQTIPSNHGIWRAVMHRKEGWNWAYWVIFRTIYGKDALKDKIRVVNAVKKTFPGTDIWSATTPASFPQACTPTSSATERACTSITVASTASDHDPATISTASSPSADKRKRSDVAPVTDAPPHKRPATSPDSPSVADGKARGSSTSVADVTNPADPAQSPDQAQGQRAPSETPGDTQGSTVTATEPLPAAKPTDRLAALEHTHLYHQVHQQLSTEFTDEIRKINERISKQAEVNGYVSELFADIRDIKRRVDALEEISKARDRIAAMYSMPPPTGFSGHSLHVAVEALGHQVDYCTRNIHELKTGQPYQDDPVLLCIKRERVVEPDPGA